MKAYVKPMVLPTPKLPPTRPCYVPLPGEVTKPSPLDTIGQRLSTEENRKHAQESKERTKERIIQMAREGKSNMEIANAVGYKYTTILRMMNKIRNEGVEIPYRKRGPQKCKK